MITACCFCGKILNESSTNNINPIKIRNNPDGRCCSECNRNIVIPTRINIKNMLDVCKEKLS